MYAVKSVPEVTYMERKVKALVLSAGKGTRLRTEGCDLPKVMRLALGKPLLGHVLDALSFLEKEDIIIVVGYKKEDIISAYPGYTFAYQAEQLGTGHAAACAKDAVGDFDGAVLVCCGDTPLITKETYLNLCNTFFSEKSDCTILSGLLPDGGSYGRIVRDGGGNFLKITEAKDCTPQELKINEVNSGLYIFSSKKLFSALGKIKNKNAQGEYYLTDVPEIILKEGGRVSICRRELGDELIGVNTPEQLKEVEDILKSR